MTLRIDIEIPKESMQDVLDALGLEATPELIDPLDVALKELKKPRGGK
jgi:hypothetical protein